MSSNIHKMKSSPLSKSFTYDFKPRGPLFLIANFDL